MITLQFEKKINAHIEKVWDALWEENNYKQWTHHFSPGSYMTSDWKQGGKTVFLDSSGQNGMVSTISIINQPEELVFEHLGYLKDGKEILSGEEVDKYKGAKEAYYMKEHDGVTTLRASVETLPEYEDHMKKGFENGLEEVKKIAEK